jgi:site-specific recombinase XerD
MQTHKPRRIERLRARRPGAVTVIPFHPDPHVDAFLDYLEAKRYSRRTVSNYRSILRIIESAMAVPLSRASRDNVNAWAAEVASRDFAAAYIQKMHASLRCFFKWAARKGLSDGGPTADLESPRKPKRLPIHMTEEQIGQLFAVISEDSPLAFREAVIVKTLYYTGMRAGELVGLTWERVNLAGAELAVIGKGDKERKIPMPSALVELLTRYKAEHPTGVGRVLLHYGETKPLTYDTVWRTVRNVLKRSGLDGLGFSPHKFRHTAATRLLHGGLPIDQIQKLLGHEQISTTTIYAHTELNEDTRQAMEAIL